MPNIFLVYGPSGSGKDSVIEGLKKYFPIKKVVTTTTRKMRPGESQGKPYYFVSKKMFAKMVKNGEFFEFARGNNGQFYGVMKKEVEKAKKSKKIIFWKVDHKGVIAIKKLLPDIKAILITSSQPVLEKRIRQRDGDNEKYIKERIAYAKETLKHKNLYDYKIENKEGKLNKAIQEVEKIIKQNIK